MRFIKNLFIGYRAYIKAFRLIIDYKLYFYIIFPAILMLGIYQVGFMIHLHEPKATATSMNGIIWYMIKLMAEILIATTLMRFAKYLVVILLSPMFSKISEKVEFILTGNRYRFNFSQLVSDVKRGFRIGIRNMMWEVFFFTIVFLIGVIGWGDFALSPVRHILFFISFYYYGFSFMDYIHERRKMGLQESIQLARENRGIALSIGSIYSVLIWNFIDLSTLFDWSSFGADPWQFMLTFLTNLGLWICASFAPIWAIVAATIAMHDLLDLKSLAKDEFAENVMN
ncbi:Sulfate transporter CysZ [compost metagenome]